MKILALETSAKSGFDRSGRKRRAAGLCLSVHRPHPLAHADADGGRHAQKRRADARRHGCGCCGRWPRLIHGPAHRHRRGQGPRLGGRTSRASAFPRSRRWRRISPTWTVCSSARWTRGAIRSTTRSLKRKAASSPASRPTAPSRSLSWRRSCAAKRAVFSCSATAGGSAATGSRQLGVESELAPAQLLYQNAVGVGLAAEHGTPVSAQELAPVYLRISQAERERNARLQQEATQK